MALQARAELEIRRRRRLRTERLAEFIPRVSPRYDAPNHLAPLLDALERTERESVRAIVSVPPRHAKTETILHAIAYRLQRRPYETIAYVTYGDRLSKGKSRLARVYAERSGMVLRDDAASLNEWRNEQMGGALFTSVGGALIGQGANVLIIDDPHKDRAEAESSLHREAVWEWYQGTAYTRVEPGGSVIILHTRWHPEDLIGRILLEHQHEGFETIVLPAISDDGAALWPERWSVEALEQRRRVIGEYDWASQFQGRPVPKGGTVFKDVRWYNPRKLPDRMRVSIGIDLAYSGKTKSDYSACVVLGEAPDKTVYVLSVTRAQCEVPAFVATIRKQVDAYPSTVVRWHTSTTETGIAQLLGTLGLPVRADIARADKFVRAQPVAARWNDGKVLLPGGFDEHGQPVPKPEWVNDFVREVSTFTGQGDKHDDMVDALTSAFEPWTHAASTAKAPPIRTTDFNGSRMGF